MWIVLWVSQFFVLKASLSKCFLSFRSWLPFVRAYVCRLLRVSKDSTSLKIHKQSDTWASWEILAQLHNNWTVLFALFMKIFVYNNSFLYHVQPLVVLTHISTQKAFVSHRSLLTVFGSQFFYNQMYVIFLKFDGPLDLHYLTLLSILCESPYMYDNESTGLLT